MKIFFKQLLSFLPIVLFSFTSLFAQTEKLWTEETPSNLFLFQKTAKQTLPTEEKIYRLDLSLLKNILKQTHQNTKAKSLKSTETVLPFPDQNGNLIYYTITETSNLSPELQAKYPTIRSYKGVSNDAKKTIIRFSVSSIGLHSMKLAGNGKSEFIDPYTKDALTYSVYAKSDLPYKRTNFICQFEDSTASKTGNKQQLNEKTNTDGKHRLFRLALSCTGEYAEYHIADQGLESGTDEEKKAGVLAAMNISMTRINGVFEKELAVSMQLVANTDDLIFLDPDTDGYTSDDDFAMVDEVQTKCDLLVGTANYDIGHLFNTGFSGLAELGSPCTNKKAQAVSGRTPANGDSFDIDFVAHEMGHQFGATHTFNNSCGNNVTASTAVETGSGSTIMAYTGICPPNVQSNSDDYFHGISLEQMYLNITFGNSTCGSESSIGNTAPTADAGQDYTIPTSTPFALNGIGTSDSGSISYCWEQIDNEQRTMPPLATSNSGPLFRSMPATSNSERHFPKIETTISGNTGSTWEQLPSVSRDLKFKLTVRDENTSGGQFATDDVRVVVEDSGSAFEVTSQTTSETLNTGESLSITWNVANTNNAPYNVDFVTILFSSDGGLTFPTVLTANTLNNGTATVVVPNIATTQGRIKVAAVDNIFYNINQSDLVVETSKFIMNLDENPVSTCIPDVAIFEFTYNTFQSFNEETTFSVSNLPDGCTATFSPTSASADATMVVLTINGLSESNAGIHDLVLTGTATTETYAVDLQLFAQETITTQPYLTAPTNNSTSHALPIEFVWNSENEANSYMIEIATDVYFSSIVETATTQLKKHTSTNLEQNTEYYWRVKETNDCNEGLYSTIYKLQTGLIEDFEFEKTENASIPDNDPNGISSMISIIDKIDIQNVSVTINISHSYVGDLVVKLTNPSGEEVVLVEVDGNRDGDNYTNTNFDDSATQTITEGTAPYTGTFIPKEALSLFYSKESNGNWTLHVSDNAADDTGELINWKLTITGVNQNSLSNEDIIGNNNPKITKGFSPNGDGINDYWVIENINTTDFSHEKFPNANVKIYTPSGQLVYSADNYKNDWNGTNQSGAKLPVGTYVFQVTFSKPEFSTQKGWLYLKY
ncbi:reprolysin-like metallopeptidase [Flavicella marina]|uniref:reprolysin-like metallopeptidase n=1 Tax=Flavicella marina TaxID=1475951 RepID=UPI001264B351|nr:zinc-dependent metalloprotease family protein [Flavicella marina]